MEGRGEFMRAAFLIVLCSVSIVFSQHSEVNGVISPEAEEKIIQQEMRV